MKIVRIISLIVVLGAAGYYAWQYFGKPNGTKYDFNGKQNIYYKGDGLDEASAKKLANYLKQSGYFGGDEKLSVQITKESAAKDTINVNFVVDKNKITEAIEKVFLENCSDLSQEAFNGNPVNVNFIDSHFDEIKKLGHSRLLNNGKKYDFTNKQNIYYKGTGLDESSAKKLASYLNEIGYFGSDKELSVQITKEKATKDTTNINFVVDRNRITETIENSFLQIGGYISQKVFSGNPVNINFIDRYFDEIKKMGYVRPASDEPAPETNNQ